LLIPAIALLLASATDVLPSSDRLALSVWECPAGLRAFQLEVKKQDFLYEGCKDAAGVRQGPFRVSSLTDRRLIGDGRNLAGKQDGEVRAYDAQGRLIYTIAYDRGEQVAFKPGEAWMDELAKRAEQLLREDGRRMTVYANHEGGLTMELTLDTARPDDLTTPDQARAARKRMTPYACKLLRDVPEAPVITIRMLWVDGQIAATETFRPNQCALQTPVVVDAPR